MAVPFLSTLTARARMAFPIIRRGVREGLSANTIQTLLTAENLGIRRTSLLGIIRRERGIVTEGARLRSLRRGLVPDPRRLPEALTKLRRAFSFTVRLRGVLIDTGEAVQRFVTVSLDRPRSRNEIERIAESFLLTEPERYQFDLEEVLLQTGTKAGAPGTLL